LQQHLPATLLASLQAVKGFDEKAFVEVHQSGAQVVSLRYNPQKDAAIKKEGDKVPWSSEGYYLDERPSFTLDPLFHAGAYYVQEASSMFLEEAIRQCCDVSLPLSVLDLCAAPGGKSTLIQSIISPESILVSNEIIKTRVNILAENIAKWGATNVVVTNNDAKDFQRLPAFFDLIVIDAPCSGSGLFRKDNDAITEWSPNNVELCSQRQQRILADIMPALKPGGVLIYSTCSYSEKEDEAISDWLTETFNLKSIALNIDKISGIVETTSPQHNCNGYRFYPDKIKGEGFFIAAFKNEQEVKSYKELKPKTKLQPLNKTELETVKPYLKNEAELTFVKWQDEVLAIPTAIYEKVVSLQAALYLKKAGVKLGSIIRTALIPDHELAVSTIISQKINRIEADLETALEYLRKKDIFLETDKKGWAILTYKELPLGLIKILPGRINNYYPKEWRILNK
jgi:16S rRNA C967 or C1407 C5-methylase (RsmB/RsmF family)/NOL1/NOP2/fmu family ribosome biogenesis protein